MDALSRAIMIATEAHAGQVDKAGEPIILHALRVMLAMETEEERIVAVLHDWLEQGNVGQCGSLYGGEIGHAERLAIDAITRGREEPYADYIERVAGNPLARRVKIADIRDNLSRPASLPDSLRDRYVAALKRLEG